MSKPDGGSAFPIPDFVYPNGNISTGSSGMSLRDHFAAKALPALVRTALDLDHAKWDATAEHAYLIADAMLKERAR